MEFASSYHFNEAFAPMCQSSYAVNYSPNLYTHHQRVDSSESIDHPDASEQTEEQNATGGDEEDNESTSRPRLTTEQSSVLEASYQQCQKPGTDAKRQLAHDVGLSLQRVNNWFQNRRAKAKQQRKQATFEVNQHLPSWAYGEFPPLSLPLSTEYHSSDFAPTPRQTATLYPSGTHNLAFPLDPDSRHRTESAYQSWDRTLEAAQAARGIFANVVLEQEDIAGHVTSSPDDSSPSNSGNNWSAQLPTLSDWGSSQNPSVIRTPAEQNDDPFTSPTYPVQDSASSFDLQASSLSSSLEPPSLEKESLRKFWEPLDTDGFSFSNTSQTSWPSEAGVKTEQASNGLGDVQKSNLLLEQAFSRRNSGSSDLASNFGTIHLQQGQSQQSPDRDIFKAPAIPTPRPGFGARRKKERPAALNPAAMRSVSCNAPLTQSPTIRSPFLGPPHILRRIKSTGQNLNGIHGRVQKMNHSAAQRSPFNLQTFADSGAFDDVNITIPHELNMHRISPAANNTPLTPFSPIRHEQQLPEYPGPLGAVYPLTSQTPSTTWSREHCYTSSGFPGALDVNSPPHTPFTPEMLGHMRQYTEQYASPPQSAPPQFTTFQHSTPPFTGNHPSSLTWNTPSMTMSEIYPYQPTFIHMPQPHHVSNVNGNPQLGILPGQHHYIGSSPPQGLYNEPAPKEIEFVQQKFPEPTGDQASNLPFTPRTYVFQNTGPKDFPS